MSTLKGWRFRAECFAPAPTLLRLSSANEFRFSAGGAVKLHKCFSFSQSDEPSLACAHKRPSIQGVRVCLTISHPVAFNSRHDFVPEKISFNLQLKQSVLPWKCTKVLSCALLLFNFVCIDADDRSGCDGRNDSWFLDAQRDRIGGRRSRKPCSSVKRES